MERQPDVILQLQVKLEENEIKNNLLKDMCERYMAECLTLELKIKVLETKIDDFMKQEERYRMMMGSKTMGG